MVRRAAAPIGVPAWTLKLVIVLALPGDARVEAILDRLRSVTRGEST